jgi:hypothetical protein
MWCNRKSLRFGSLGKCLLPFILLAATLKVCKPTGSGSTVSQLAGPISGNQTVDLKCTSKTPAASKDNSTFYYEPIVTYQFNTSWEVGKANSNPPFVYQALQYQGTGKNKKKTGRSSEFKKSIEPASYQTLTGLNRTVRDHTNKDKANPQNMPKGFLVQLDFTLGKAAISNVGKEVFVVESIKVFDQNFNSAETYIELTCEKPKPSLLVGNTSLCPPSKKPIEILVQFNLPPNDSFRNYFYSVSTAQPPGAQSTNQLHLIPAPEKKVPLSAGPGESMVARFETKNMGSFIINLLKNDKNILTFPLNTTFLQCGGEMEGHYVGANSKVTSIGKGRGVKNPENSPFQQTITFETSLVEETSVTGKGTESILLCQVVTSLNHIKQAACGIAENQGRAPGRIELCKFGKQVGGVNFREPVCYYTTSNEKHSKPGCYFNDNTWSELESNKDLMEHSHLLGTAGCPNFDRE